MEITPQTVLPADPDEVKDDLPPGAVLLNGTPGIEVQLAVSAGSATLTPYYYGAGQWWPLGDDAGGVRSVTADFAGVTSATGRFVRPSEPRWWCLLKTGAGTVSACEISETQFG